MAKNKDQSILGKAATTVPLAVGVGITAYNIYKSPIQFKNPISALTPANNMIHAAVSNFTDPGRAANKWNHSINAAITSANLPPQVVMDSWKQALSYSGFSEGSINEIIGKIQGTTTEQIVNDISQAMATGKHSVYMQRAISRFAQDTNIFASIARRGGNLNLSSIAIPESQFEKLSSSSIKGIFPSGVQDKFIESKLFEMQSMLDAEMKISINKRSDIPGSELVVQYSKGKLPGTLELRVPRVLSENPNLVIRGATQQSKYIAGQFGIIEGNKIVSTLNYEQFMIARAQEELIPTLLHNKQLNNSSLKKITSEFHSKMAENLEWIESLPTGTHQGLDEYIKQRSNIMHLYGKYGAQLDELTQSKILEQGYLINEFGHKVNIFPGASATQISKNTVYLSDPRQMYLFPEAMQFGRRPLQPIRREFAPTQQALDIMQQDYFNKEFAWAKMQGGIESPMLRTAYISEKYADQLAREGMGTQGGGFISSYVSPQRKIRELTTYNLSTSAVGEDIKSLFPEGATSWNINKSISKGTILGRDPLGKLMQTEEDLKILTATIFQDKNQGQMLKLVAEKEIDDLKWSKVFGGGKGMFAEISQQRMNYITGHFNAKHIGEVHAIISAGELKKNKGLLWNQVFTSLWDYSKQNMNSGKQLGALASNFTHDPRKMINKIRTIATRGDIINDDKLVAATMRLARSAKLSPEQLGSVFGAIPDVLMSASSDIGIAQEWTQKGWGILSAQEATMINRRIATGASQLMFGGSLGPGSGYAATLEPRIFELLQANQFGPVSVDIQEDLVKRMISQHGFRLTEQETIARSIKSMLDPSFSTTGIKSSTVINNLEKYMETGFNLDIPTIGTINVPAESVLSQMSQFKTSSGQTIEGTLSKSYKDLIRNVADFESGTITRQTLNEQFNKTISEATSGYLATITGEGGLLRNRIPGSTFLTGVPNAFKYKLQDEYTVGITKKYASQMFEQMKDIYDPTDIENMRLAFEKGQTIPGMMARHPAIGPYSIIPVKYKMVPGNEAVAVFNEMERKALITSGNKMLSEQGAMEALKGDANRLLALKQAGTSLTEGLRLSPLVGMAGDVDADIYAAWFAGPQLTKNLGEFVGTSDYEEYMLRSQLLKTKAKKSANLTLSQLAADDAMKMGIPQTRLGQLSVQLQQARAGVLQGNLTKFEKSQALGLLEFLEQTPISGKHLAPGQAPKMLDLFADIQQSLRRADSNLLKSTITNLFDEEALAGYKGSLLGEGVTVSYMDANNKLAQKFVRGFNLDKTVANITSGIDILQTSKAGEFSGARLHEALMGRVKTFNPSEARSLISNMETGFLKDFFLAPQKTGTIAQLSKMTQSLSNELAGAGKSMISLAKPLAFGLAGSLAIASLLSAPPIALDTDMKQPPVPNLTGGTGGQYMDANNLTGKNINGRPGTPDSISGGKHYISRNRSNRSYNIDIRAQSHGANYSRISNSISRSFNLDTRINSHIQDDRSSLTPQRVSDILKK